MIYIDRVDRLQPQFPYIPVSKQSSWGDLPSFEVRSAISNAEANDIMSRWQPTLPGFRNSLCGVEADPDHWKREDAKVYAARLAEWDAALRQPTAVAFV